MLKNKKALVTGSSRGIGRKIVEVFLANGAEVWGLCSKPSAAKEELEKYAEENGTKFHEICANVGDAEQLSEVVKAALAEAGNFDILVNNAGITRDGLSFRMKMEDWQSVLNVNLTGTFVVTQIVSNAMLKARTGSIINMSSIVGIHGQGGQVNYSASKGGLIAYIENGDKIKIDIPQRTLILDVDNETIENRKKLYVAPEIKERTGFLAKYAKTVQSASKGAITI